MKVLLSILLACSVAFSAPMLNFQGTVDTTFAGSTFMKDSVFIGKAWRLTNGENTILYVLADDSSALGYDNDSLKIQWGYQIGWPQDSGVGFLDDSTSNWDSVWSNAIVVDTFILDTGASNEYCPDDISGAAYWLTTASDGSIEAVGGQVDTCSISGWALQWAGVSPPWAPYIRMWFKALAGTKELIPVKLRGGKIQRDHIETER